MPKEDPVQQPVEQMTPLERLRLALEQARDQLANVIEKLLRQVEEEDSAARERAGVAG